MHATLETGESIPEIPPNLQPSYKEFIEALNKKELRNAQRALSPIVNHFAENEEEMPYILQIQYGSLLALEKSTEGGR